MARILIVEGRSSAAMTQAYQLWNAGHEVETAATGAEALALASATAPDLMVLECHLPDMNGVALLEALRDQGIDAPSILVTSQHDERLVVKAMQPGVADYLVIAADAMEALGSVVETMLNEVHVRRQPTPHAAEREHSEETQRVLLNASSAATVLVDASGRVLSINEAGRTLLGLEAGQRTDSPVFGFDPPNGDPDAPTLMRAVLETGEPASFELTYKGRYLESSLWPVRGSDDQVARVAIFCRDITERRTAERTLRRSKETLERQVQERTAALVESNAGLQQKVTELARAKIALARSEADLVRAQRMAHLGSWELNLQTQMARCSGEALHILGIAEAAAQLPWEAFLERVHPADRASLQERLERAIRDRSAVSLDHRILTNGSERFVHFQGEVDPRPAGRPLRMVGTLLDITRRKTSERELQQSRELLQTVFDTYPHWLWVVDSEGRFLMVNRKLAADFGIGSSAWIGRSHAELGLLPPDFCAVSRRQEQAVLASAAPQNEPEVHLTGRDGSRRAYAMARVPLRDELGTIVGIVGIAEDITERIAAEQERRLLATAVSQAAEAIVVADRQGTVQYVNPAVERITGYAREEVLGRPAQFLGQEPDPAIGAASVWETLARGDSWQGRVACRRKDGKGYIVASTISPIFDAAGALSAYVVVNRDVTRQQQLEADLRQSQKLEAIGTMVSGIAHEINNILTPVMGYAELLHKQLTPASPLHDYSAEIRKSVLRARDLIASILTVSRKHKPGVTAISLSSLAAEVMSLIRATLPKNIQIQESTAEPDLFVLADAAQIQTVLMNLCINAAHAMPDGGELTVGLQRVELRGEPLPRPERPAGEYARITVRDTGVGMDEATRERVFEPFFTTKESGKGTGLGLYLVYGIVQEYRGFIDLHSVVGAGTTFEVYLPIAQPAAATQAATAAAVDPRGSGSVLVVDDEEEIRSYLTRILGDWGYAVTACKNGQEGWACFQANPAAFAVVITDFMCPPMLGDELVTHIRAIRPDLPCIVATGFAETLQGSRGGLDEATLTLRKPWTQDELAQTLRSALARRPAPAGAAALAPLPPFPEAAHALPAPAGGDRGDPPLGRD